MRNIAIAERKDWVTSQPVARPPARRSRMRAWLGKIPIILLVPALVIPYVLTAAAGPALRANPDEATAGQRIVVRGESFDRREAGFLVWAADGSVAATYRASLRGRFSAKVVVPKSMKIGDHDLTALGPAGILRATISLEVVDAAAAPPEATPAPTLAPTPEPTPEPTPAPTRAPTPTPTSVPATLTPGTPAPTRSPAPTATPAPTRSLAPAATPAPTSTPAPTRSPAPTQGTGGGGILISSADLLARPMSGAAWTALKARADSATGTPLISNQDDNTDQTVLAKALVYARTGGSTYRAAVLTAIKSAVGTEAGGRTLALGRNLPAYVISADLIGLRTLDATYDTTVFRLWLRALLTKTLDGRTLVSTHEGRPNNWGTHAGAARAAVAAYLGDTAQLARTAQVFRGYLGDRTAYADFKYGDLAWQCDPAKPVGINPAGCIRSGIVIDGVLPDDMRRGGSFQWPPVATGYPWEGLQGAVLQAELLRRAGYDAWNWSDRALLRATRFLYARAGWPAVGDDEWQPWLIDVRYGTAYHSAAPARTGKNFGYTDWLYGG